MGADTVSAEQWKSIKLPNLLQKFCAKDIYNVNKTGLFYSATPEDSLIYNHTTLSGSKKKQWIMWLCWAVQNMPETDENISYWLLGKVLSLSVLRK